MKSTLAALIVLVLGVASCSIRGGSPDLDSGSRGNSESQSERFHRALLVSEESYTSSLKILSELERSGAIDKRQMTRALEISERWQSIHNLLLESLTLSLGFSGEGSAGLDPSALVELAVVSAELGKLLSEWR